MKHLLLSVGAISSLAAPLLTTVSVDMEQSKNISNNKNVKPMYFFKGKIYNSKNQIYKEYILSHPELIKQKNVIGDIDKSIIDLDSNMLNVSDLPDFDPSKIYPVYLKTDGSYEKDFEKARESKINPALTTNDFTDGFGNFFKSKEAAQASYKWKVLNGKLAVNTLPLVNGQIVNTNPLSEKDNEYFKNSTLSYLQNNANIDERYGKVFLKNDKKITNFYDVFNTNNSLKSAIDSTVSKYNSMHAIYSSLEPNEVRNSASKIDAIATLEGIDKNELKQLPSPEVKISGDDLKTFANAAYLRNFNGDIGKYRSSLLKQIEDNQNKDEMFNIKHQNDYTNPKIEISANRDKSKERYKFLYVDVENAETGQIWDSDKDYGEHIIFNGITQDHRASYYQRYVQWDGDADSDFRAYNIKLWFKDSFEPKTGCITIRVNGGRDTDYRDEDYASYEILKNSLFGQNVPVWGGRTTLNGKQFVSGSNEGSSDGKYPWILGNHDKDSGNDDEWGYILKGFDSSQLRSNPKFYNGNKTSRTIFDYKETLLKYLNNKSNQNVFPKSFGYVTPRNIYMSKAEKQKLLNDNPFKISKTPAEIERLSKYIKFNAEQSLSSWVKNMKFSNINVIEGGNALLVSYLKQDIYDGITWRFEPGKIRIPIMPKFDSNNRQVDWVGKNIDLKNKYLSLNQIDKPFINWNTKFNSSSFDPKKSILADGNKTLTLTYNQYKDIWSSDSLNKIYIDVVSKNGLHMSYKLDISKYRNNKDFISFSNLMDSQNILEEDKKNIILKIDFSKVSFKDSSNKDILQGINLEWDVIKKYSFKQPPVSLDMNKINKESIERNSLLATLKELYKRSSEYSLSEENKTTLKNSIANFYDDMKEELLFDNSPLFEVTRNNSMVTGNNVADIKYLNKSFDINKLFSIIKDETKKTKIIKAYNDGYLVEFKELIKKLEIKELSSFDTLSNEEKISYSYLYTLKKYILNSSIVGQLPNDSHFKLPDFGNVLWDIGKINLKTYLVQSQYVFNGSLLTYELNSIGKGNLFDNSESQEFRDFRNRVTESFLPPRVTQLYDVNGREFQIDNTGSLLYDNEETVIKNCILKSYPDKINGMVFYEGLPKPILNQVSMIYYLKIEEQTYYFKDYNSTYIFIKEYLNRFVQEIEGESYD